jgi:ankyrin repeat protein
MIKGSRSMRRASANGRIDVLEALLKYGGDVNEVADCKDIDGPPGTALHAAADAQNEEAVRWLLAHGADDTLKNKDGISAREIMEDKGMVV